MSKHVLATLLLFLFTNCLYAQEWIYVTSSKDDKFFIREAGTSDMGYKKVWEKHTTEQLVVEMKRRKKLVVPNGYVVSLHEYDCEERFTRTRRIVYYRSDGTVVDSIEFEEHEAKWRAVVPGSIGESMLNKGCREF